MKSGKFWVCFFFLIKKNPNKPKTAGSVFAVPAARAAAGGGGGSGGDEQAGASVFVRIQPLDLSFLSDG